MAREYQQPQAPRGRGPYDAEEDLQYTPPGSGEKREELLDRADSALGDIDSALGENDKAGVGQDKSDGSVAGQEKTAGQDEAQPTGPMHGPVTNEQRALGNVLGFDPTDDDASWKTSIGGRGKVAKNIVGRRRVFAAGGLFGLIVAGILGFIIVLLPYKVTSIIESIEDRVGQVPQYAVEQRLEYYMNKYLMIRALERIGTAEALDIRNREFVYLDGSAFDTLYTNWKGANLESELFTSNGVRLEPINLDTGLGRRRTRPQNWQLIDEGLGRDSPLNNRTLDSAEARLFIKDFTRERTKWYQVIKRHHNRLILKKYFGVANWKPFEQKVEEKRRSYFEKKKQFKKNLIEKTVGGTRVGVYLDCIVENDSDCRKKLREESPGGTNEFVDDSEAQEEIDNVATDADETPGSAPDPNAPDSPRSVSRFFQKLATKRILASIISGVGILSAASNIVQAVDDGVVNQVVYSRNAQQYASYTSTFLSGEDQQAAGVDYSATDAQILAEPFDNFQQSPVYQADSGIPALSFSGTAFAQERTVARDCDNDGQAETLEPGELVCPDRKLLQDKTSFTDSTAWNKVIVPLSDVIDSTIGPLVDFFSGIVDALIDISGLDSAIEKILEKFGIDKALSSAFSAFLNRILGVAATGAEEGADAYDNLYGGLTVMQGSLGGNVGVDRENTIGGAYLNEQQVAAINRATNRQQQYRLNNMNVFARYFSPDVPGSLTSVAAMHAPATLGSGLSVASSLLGPSGIFGSVANLFTPPASAAIGDSLNPFGAINMGYDPNDPVFTANNGDGMDPDEIERKYQCEKSPGDRPQNKLEEVPGVPFKVYTEPDPCFLEEVVEQSGSMYFTGQFDEGIDAESSSTTPSGTKPNGVVGADEIGPIPGIEPGCHVSIVDQVKDMLQAAKQDGLTLTGSCWRDPQKQIELRRQNCGPSQYDIYQKPSGLCSPPTAIPGTSMHERGLAIDFSNCGTQSTPCWRWLNNNAGRYGLRNLQSEPWHWSTTGN